MKGLGNIKHKTLREVAYDSIKTSVLKNELMSGEHLTISDLAARLGSSSTPVREAVVRLSNEGILDYEVNKRIKVSEVTEQNIKEVYDARRMLEIEVAKRIPAHLKDNVQYRKQFESLKEETLLLVESDQDPDRYSQIDLQLNKLFIELLYNRIIKELFSTLGEKSLRIRTFVEATRKYNHTPGDELRLIAKEHLGIIEAILGGNKNIIAKSVELHLTNGEKRTLKAIKKD